MQEPGRLRRCYTPATTKKLECAPVTPLLDGWWLVLLLVAAAAGGALAWRGSVGPALALVWALGALGFWALVTGDFLSVANGDGLLFGAIGILTLAAPVAVVATAAGVGVALGRLRHLRSEGRGAAYPAATWAVVTAVLLVIVTALDRPGPAPTGPSDADLIAGFQYHQPAFERLIALSDADPGMEMISMHRWSHDISGLTTSPGRHTPSYEDRRRWEGSLDLKAFRQVLPDTGLPYGLERDFDGRIWFPAWAVVYRGVSLERGYVRLRQPPTATVAALDTSGVVPAYRQIDGDWYLFQRSISRFEYDMLSSRAIPDPHMPADGDIPGS